jgi:RNA polymerase sigma factor (sigma-70 family)
VLVKPPSTSKGLCKLVSAATVTNESVLPADGVLLEAVKLGDHTAFEQLFERYYSSVYSVSRRILGSPEDAEEIALDVFMKLYERPIERVEGGALGGWLYRTALNASFNELRSRRRRLGWLKRVASLRRTAAGVADDPAETVERNSEAATVRRGLARLPEQQRNALVLRSHGFQYREIAAVLEIATSSVGTTLVRAERSLREQLENEVEL